MYHTSHVSPSLGPNSQNFKLPTNGCCCEEHTICGTVLTDDCVVRFRKVQVIVNEKEESAIAVLWVSDGVDWCHISFIPWHHVKHWKKLKGVLAQIAEVYTGDSDSPTKHQKHYRSSGVAIGAIISGPLFVVEPGSPKKEHKVNDMTNGNPEQNKDDDLDSSIISND